MQVPPGKRSQKQEYGTKDQTLAIKMPTSEKLGEFVILEFKRMSDVADQYVTRAKRVAIAQYASIKSALEQTLGRHRVHKIKVIF